MGHKSCTWCTGHRNRCAPSLRWAGLTEEAHMLEAKGQLARKKNLESRVRGIFQRDDAPGIGAVQMPFRRVGCGAGSTSE